MNLRIDLLAGAVILAGATTLGHPAQAHATYLNPLDAAANSGSSSGVVYCCKTGDTAQCCSSTGCATREGMCISIR
jgi:hypothetical protein